MSGECYFCGEHALDCQCDEEKICIEFTNDQIEILLESLELRASTIASDPYDVLSQIYSLIWMIVKKRDAVSEEKPT